MTWRALSISLYSEAPAALQQLDKKNDAIVRYVIDCGTIAATAK
jgi:hypothetical protein